MSARQVSEGCSGSVGWYKKLVSTSNSKIGKMESYLKRKFFTGRDESVSVVEYIGTAVVMKKLKVLDLIDRVADVEDDTSEAIVRKHVSVQLVSTELLDLRKYAQNNS
jgi:lipoxygenase